MNRLRLDRRTEQHDCPHCGRRFSATGYFDGSERDQNCPHCGAELVVTWPLHNPIPTRWLPLWEQCEREHRAGFASVPVAIGNLRQLLEAAADLEALHGPERPEADPPRAGA